MQEEGLASSSQLAAMGPLLRTQVSTLSYPIHASAEVPEMPAASTSISGGSLEPVWVNVWEPMEIQVSCCEGVLL